MNALVFRFHFFVLIRHGLQLTVPYCVMAVLDTAIQEKKGHPPKVDCRVKRGNNSDGLIDVTG